MYTSNPKYKEAINDENLEAGNILMINSLDDLPDYAKEYLATS